jgi:hypothetical protein
MIALGGAARKIFDQCGKPRMHVTRRRRLFRPRP